MLYSYRDALDIPCERVYTKPNGVVILSYRGNLEFLFEWSPEEDGGYMEGDQWEYLGSALGQRVQSLFTQSMLGGMNKEALMYEVWKVLAKQGG